MQFQCIYLHHPPVVLRPWVEVQVIWGADMKLQHFKWTELQFKVRSDVALFDPWPHFRPSQAKPRYWPLFTKSGGAAAALSVPLRRRVSEPSDLSQTALGFLRRQCLAKTETNWCCPGRSAVNDSLSVVLMNLCSARSRVQDKDPYDRAH